MHLRERRKTKSDVEGKREKELLHRRIKVLIAVHFIRHCRKKLGREKFFISHSLGTRYRELICYAETRD
jgi:hypothetical protein